MYIDRITPVIKIEINFAEAKDDYQKLVVQVNMNIIKYKIKKSLKKATQKEKNMVLYTSKNKSTNFTCTSIVCKNRV